MKKVLSLLLVCLLVAALFGCGEDSDAPTIQPTNPNTSATQDPSGTETPTQAPTSAATEAPTTAPTTAPTEPKRKAFNKTGTIEETVLYEADGVKITATELTYTNSSAKLSLVIENNSDADLSFIASSAGYACNAINGYMISTGYLNCDVAAGKKATDSVSFSYSELMVYGIYEIADIEIGFDIYDDDYNHTYTGPCEITTSLADGYDYSITRFRDNFSSPDFQREHGITVPYFSDEACFDSDSITIASQAILINKDGETCLMLEVVNSTAESITAYTANIEINGLRVYTSLWSKDSVNAGATAILDVNLNDVLKPEYWEGFGISEIGAITLDVVFDDHLGNELPGPGRMTFTVPNADTNLNLDGLEAYNHNGIRLITKGVYADPSEYSDDLHLLMIAQNTSGYMVSIQDVYDSLSINDYMADYSFYGVTLYDGSCVAINIRLWDSGLEDIGISDPSEIETIEFSIKIRDEAYNEMDKPTMLHLCYPPVALLYHTSNHFLM